MNQFRLGGKDWAGVACWPVRTSGHGLKAVMYFVPGASALPTSQPAQANLDLADETVPIGLSCPACGESHMDQLLITDGDEIECAACGALYAID